LGVPNVVKCVALALTILSISKEAAIFSFSRGSHDTIKNGAATMDGTIDEVGIGMTP
jgi:hypothetical protein